jgi:hypothetical protein
VALIRVSRGIPKYNIQIGPITEALKYNPSAILSVTDQFEWSLMQFPHFMWAPINEIGKSWGYMPFFAAKKILDFWCLELGLPYIYLCCSAGKHRSPLTAFCWLLSQPTATPESVSAEFFGKFDQSPLDMYQSDIKNGYIPNDLPEFYKLMNQYPGWSYRAILQGMLKYENITFTDSKWATKR